MQNAAGQTVGIRLRLPTGRKLAVKGSRQGLFLPEGIEPGGRLFVAEGPTDAAALLDLAFRAVGRPSCSGGVWHVVGLVKRLGPEEVVIVADGDPPGQSGANRLASSLAAYVPAVRVITPPPGVKDARAWKRSGATAADVEAAIDAAEPRRLPICTHDTRQLTPNRR
jgi:DNA primase